MINVHPNVAKTNLLELKIKVEERQKEKRYVFKYRVSRQHGSSQAVAGSPTAGDRGQREYKTRSLTYVEAATIVSILW